MTESPTKSKCICVRHFLRNSSTMVVTMLIPRLASTFPPPTDVKCQHSHGRGLTFNKIFILFVQHFKKMEFMAIHHNTLASKMYVHVK